MPTLLGFALNKLWDDGFRLLGMLLAAILPHHNIERIHRLSQIDPVVSPLGCRVDFAVNPAIFRQLANKATTTLGFNGRNVQPIVLLEVRLKFVEIVYLGFDERYAFGNSDATLSMTAFRSEIRIRPFFLT